MLVAPLSEKSVQSATTASKMIMLLDLIFIFTAAFPPVLLVIVCSLMKTGTLISRENPFVDEHTVIQNSLPSHPTSTAVNVSHSSLVVSGSSAPKLSTKSKQITKSNPEKNQSKKHATTVGQLLGIAIGLVSSMTKSKLYLFS